VLEASGLEGWAEVEGERWRVRLAPGGTADATRRLQAGERVRVARVDGLTLHVTPITHNDNTQGASR
jgi:membrane-bound ClpP family serine protease